jgi:acetyltransferase-like isoleucine patch superfamily enzyme
MTGGSLIQKYLSYQKRYGWAYAFRKSVYFILQHLRLGLIRRLRCIFYFRSQTLRIGKNVSIRGILKNVRIGAYNNYYDHCIFDFGPEAEFITGDHVILSYYVVVQCNLKIQIGNFVQIGEFSSIRDTTHTYDVRGMMMETGDRSESITIGNNVWIGRNCLICEGAVIEEGVVVAAHSVVKGRLEKDGIYGGAPARFIKSRLGK